MNLLRSWIILIVFTAVTGSVQQAFGDIHLPRLLSDGAIFQRETNNILQGWASNGEQVNILLNGKKVGQSSVEHGRWRFELTAQPAGGPHTLEFIGNNQLKLQDIYFGDVWVASGQSNMETTISRVKYKYADEISKANYPQIREFRVPKKYHFGRAKRDFSDGQWTKASPESIEKLSAVAYFFAKNIQQKHKVPIGIINNSYGGSTAEGWMSEEALEDFPEHLKTALSYRNTSYLQSLINEDKRNADKWHSALNNNDLGLRETHKWYQAKLDIRKWPTISIPGTLKEAGLTFENGAVWLRKELILPQSFGREHGMLELGRLVDADMAYINGNKVGETSYLYPPRRYEFKPGTLRAGKNTIALRLVVRAGQGEFVKDKPYVLHVGKTKIDLSGNWQYQIGAKLKPIAKTQFNAHLAPMGFYNAMLAPLFDTAIKGVIWYQGESNTDRAEEYSSLFPAMIREWRERWGQGDFPFVFVQLANFLPAKEEPVESQWADTRAAQAAALNEANTAMAVAIDLGEWNDIHPKDKQSVGERLALAARHLAYAEQTLVHSGPVFRSLKVKGKKVTLEFDKMGGGLQARGETLGGFAIAGADGKFHWASTKLKKKKIIIWSDNISEPVKVRYAWADNPDKANLYNKEGLPAAPFEAEVVRE